MSDYYDRYERGDRGAERGDYEDRREHDERGFDEGRGGGRGAFKRRKVCRFCSDQAAKIDYRDAGALRLFVSERGKIVPRRLSGVCAKHQREIASAVKRARSLALLPYVITG